MDMDKKDMQLDRCLASVKKTGNRCRKKVVRDGVFCPLHNKDLPIPVPEAGPSPESKEPSLRERVDDISQDPDLLELSKGVAAIKALLEEHIGQLDTARGRGGEDAANDYCSALETHGKRIQSLAGDLFKVIDRFSRIQERRRMVLEPEEVKGLIARIKERVIEAVESSVEGETREELARRLAAAFDSISIVEREQK